MAYRLIIPRFIHWSAVNTLSNSFAARATILIPLIGYLILFNEKMSDYLNLIGVLNGSDNHHGISLRLLSLYMGLCFVAAAVMIYSLRCPREIKGFNTAPEFISQVQDTISGPSLRVIEVAVSSVPGMEDEFEALRMVRVGNGFEVELDKENYVRGLLFLYFQILDECREYSRLICLVLYGLGFAFIAMPSLAVFWRIVRIFVAIMMEGVATLAK